MRDYIRRFLIAGIMALCVTLLFLGGKHSQAEDNIREVTGEWIWPADGMISDTFGTRHGNHKGIDIAAALGTPVYTVDKGTVSKSYYSDTYGHVVFVKHPNNTETVYAHLKSRFVNEGEQVEGSQQIGEMGNTGDSSGVHLHFEIHLNEWTVDKTNAIDPITALGEVKVGQYVASLPKPQEKALETWAKAKMYQAVENQETTATSDLPYIRPKLSTSTPTPLEIHTVQEGDTLWSIAVKYALTVEKLMELNQLETNKIIPLQILKLE